MQKQYRTRCRESIMNFLKKQADRSFSAADIYMDLTKDEAAINLATVYRNLEKLTDCGMLMKFKTAGEECCRYQYAEPDGNCQTHIHMQCRECGRMLHLECGFMDELTSHLLKHHDFTLECPGSVLSGLCGDCSKK